MPRAVRTHIVSETKPTMVPRHLSKAEFGNRLYKLMLSRGWSQSELARQAGLPRDSISTYIRGVSTPTPANLDRLARALGVKADDLLPNVLETAIEEDMPAFSMQASVNAPGKAWLRVNRAVSFSTASKIAELLAAEDAQAAS